MKIPRESCVLKNGQDIIVRRFCSNKINERDAKLTVPITAFLSPESFS